jgi:hypothetical protein
MTTDCLVLSFGLQRKSPRRDVARILQREKETLQTRVSFPPARAIPLHWSESTENVPVRVQDHSQSVCVPVAAAVKVRHGETVAAAAPQKSKLFFVEVLKVGRKVRNDRRIPPRRRPNSARRRGPLCWPCGRGSRRGRRNRVMGFLLLCGCDRFSWRWHNRCSSQSRNFGLDCICEVDAAFFCAPSAKSLTSLNALRRVSTSL